jgi:prefoldin subunit 5
MGVAKKPKTTSQEKWKELIKQIEDIKKIINNDKENLINIDGKNYTFADFTEMVLEVVRERETPDP